jgi:hypothetical protein
MMLAPARWIPPGDGIEQPPTVGRDHRHQRCDALLVIFATDRELVIGAARGLGMHQIGRDDIGRLGDPVGIVEALADAVRQIGALAQQFGDLRPIKMPRHQKSRASTHERRAESRLLISDVAKQRMREE